MGSVLNWIKIKEWKAIGSTYSMSFRTRIRAFMILSTCNLSIGLYNFATVLFWFGSRTQFMRFNLFMHFNLNNLCVSISFFIINEDLGINFFFTREEWRKYRNNKLNIKVLAPFEESNCESLKHENSICAERIWIIVEYHT